MNTMPMIGRLYEVRAAQELAVHDSDEPQASSPLPATVRKEALQDDAPALPFVGQFLSYLPGESIVIERRLTLEEDLHLADHTFVHAPGIKPLSACLPVLPLTVGLEIMAETAACLAPGYGLIGFEDIEARRWIEFKDTDNLTLQIEGRLLRFDTTHDAYHVFVAIVVKGQPASAMSARLVFGARYLLTLPLSFTELTDDYRYPLTADEIYAQRTLFHGPCFQCLTGSIVIGAQGATGELLVRSQQDLFRSTRYPQLLTDPTLLDAVGQMIGIWAMEQDNYVFPIGIAKIEIYRPTPATGTCIPVRMQITHDSVRTLQADIEVQDGAGAVWMRIKGWKMWKFHWEKRLVDFRRLPTRNLLSEAFSLPALDPSGVCQRLSASRLIGFDAELLARYYLHMDEMAAFSRHAGVPQRQRQWLLGRIVAKDAVRAWAARQTGAEEMLHPAAFAIENDVKGRPIVNRWSDSLPPNVSIAHCKDHAIAIAYGGSVGVDIERVVERDADFLHGISTPSERDLLESSAGGSQHEWITRLWCAKEVLGKLMGTGIDGAPQQFEAQVLGTGGMLQMRHRHSGREARVHLVREDNFIVAYAMDSVAPTYS